jgi:hypothetical protein
MATYGHTFTSGDTLTPPKLNDARTVTDIVDADIASGANIALSKLATGALPTAITVANANLADDDVTPAKLSQPLTFRTAQATTSGLAINFTDIPSWVKRITVMLNQVSTNGTSGLIIQLGDSSGGYKTSGYIGTGTAITGTNTCGISDFTAGFNAGTGTTITSSRSGCVFLLNPGGNTWLASGTVTNGLVAAGHVQGVAVLSGVLDRLRLTTNGGTNTFDAGSVNIAYEG